jgi:hypothetical protein
MQYSYRLARSENLKTTGIRSRAVELEDVLTVFERMGVDVRSEPLGGDGGGLCRLRGKAVLFVDTMADSATRLQRALEGLADLPGIDDAYLRPDLRDAVDRIREEHDVA